MMNCKEIGKLVSEGMDHDLSWTQKLKVRMHLSMCSMCRGVAKQLQFMRRLARRIGDPSSDTLLARSMSEQHLSGDVKSRIKAEMARRQS